VICSSFACLAAPPDAGDDLAPDAAPPLSACGSARVDIAYMSRFWVDPDGYGNASLDRVGLVINSGAGLIDLAGLEVLDATVDDSESSLVFAASDGGGALPPGEARGKLSMDGRDMVLDRLSETWTDPDAPDLSGLLFTSRSQGDLHGTVLLALGPHRLSLDLEFDLTTFQGSGAYPRDARRVSSTCVDGS
jgi:hypothetical protein